MLFKQTTPTTRSSAKTGKVTLITCTLISAALALSGCSSVGDLLQSDRVDYKSSGKAGPSLDVPPDLTQLTRDTRYVVPGTAASANALQVGQNAQALPMASLAVGDVRVERAGNQRWLVVNRPADKLWSPVRDFWLESGFLLALDEEKLGIMETDFAENRAKLPQDFIRNTLGKVLDSLYSTGERDKFRTRLERTAAGGTEIYISHRGMQETIVGTAKSGSPQGDGTVWQGVPPNPELEAEFLQRLMLKLGVPQEQSKALVATNATRSTSRLATVNGAPVVQIDEGFDRSWRRVGLTLDRTGFTVEDRDRAQGLYFVRYVDITSDKKEPGFFSKLFSASTAQTAPLKYRIAVKSDGNGTTVSVLNALGAVEPSANAQRIVQVIADDLK